MRGVEVVNTTVTRHNFFRGVAQYERFTEHAPLCVEEAEHDVCNCTKSVVERPPGEPAIISQTVKFTEQVGPYRMQLSLGASTDTADNNAAMFSIYWPRDAGKPPRRHGEKGEHAYFWFTRDDHLKVEVSGTGDNGDIDCTLGDVFFGNEVDLSKLRNGWMPSKVVDLSTLTPDDVWTHYCLFGPEARSKLSNEREIGRLQKLRQLASRIKEEIAQCSVFDASVSDVRARVTGTDADRWHVMDAFNLLEKLVPGFRDSALRRDIARVHEEALRVMFERQNREQVES